MQIKITATDRNGRHLETRVVSGPSFRDTFEARGQVYDHFRSSYSDHQGIGPYIFTETVYETGDN